MARTLTLLAFALCSAQVMGAITVQLDYRFDTGGFFNNPAARTALETGIQNIASRLQDTLSPITPGPTPFGFSNQFNAVITHPSTGAQTTINDLAIPSNTLVVFVGAYDLPGSTLGFGGPGGFNGSGSSDFLDNIPRRGEGETTGPGAVDFAPWGGQIAFDSAAAWSFDTSAANPSGSLNSFISVVEHEFGHLLGIGSSPRWNNLRQTIGGSPFFTGVASTDAHGGFVPLADGAHWAEGTMSFVGGVPQEAAMDPTLLRGTRKQFTKLDFAALYDIGWEVAGVPEASSWQMAVLVLGMGAISHRLARR